MSQPAIIVDGISKKYRIGLKERPHQTFREAATGLISAPLRLARSRSQRPPDADRADFWALKDVSFEVQPGEVVGIIGRNGAGKSTLLKILSRITEPTSGEIRLTGRVASLLEVGTGFHPELTGRENIYLNGAILGMKRAEITHKFDEIVAFAETEKFLDTPVKYYSSGMYVRLAFAVAAHLEPEILIVDEVLAVGDAEFQRKCLGKMRDVSKAHGRTVLFVSHNMPTIAQLCSSAVLLVGGRAEMYDRTEAVISRYLRDLRHFPKHPANSEHFEVLDVAVGASSGAIGSNVFFSEEGFLKLTLRARKTITDVAIVIHLHDENDVHVATLCTPEEGIEPFRLSAGQKVNLSCHLGKISLMPKRYLVSVFVFRPHDPFTYLAAERAAAIDISPVVLPGGMWPYGVENRRHGIMRLAEKATLSFET